MLGDVAWTDVAERPGILLVPVGSCEQHGPHLPLDTDTRIAVAVAERVAAIRPTVRVAPALTYGASGEHAEFPGTLSLGSDVMATVLIELVRSADWADAVVFVNGHGGNADAVRRAQNVLQGEGREVRSWAPALEHSDAHAGRTETSILLALAPDVVHVERAERGVVTPLTELLPVLRANGVRAVSANGILGDPTGASVEEGQRLLDELTASLAALVDR